MNYAFCRFYPGIFRVIHHMQHDPELPATKPGISEMCFLSDEWVWDRQIKEKIYLEVILIQYISRLKMSPLCVYTHLVIQEHFINYEEKGGGRETTRSYFPIYFYLVWLGEIQHMPP